MKKLLLMPLAIFRIRREVAKFKPDHIVLEGASWAVYLFLLAFVLRVTLPAVKIVYHAHNVEYLLRLERNNKLLAAVTRCAERCVLALCHQCFAVSREDCQHFYSLYGVSPDLLPNGVDCSAARVKADEIVAIRERFAITDESILFIGLYAYPPNMEAVRFLIEDVMPELHRRQPNVRLVITGGGPPLSASWFINAGILPRSELDALLCACRIGVAPIFKGSGTRLKILEYMAAGLPVVTTRKGAEGLDLEGGTHVLFAETSAEFQDSLLRLLSDQPLSDNLSIKAAELVRAKFDWGLLLHQFAAHLLSG